MTTGTDDRKIGSSILSAEARKQVTEASMQALADWLRNMANNPWHGSETLAGWASAVESLEASRIAPEGQAAEPLTETYVQSVPDHCDRIIWRNRYYSLPLGTPKERGDALLAKVYQQMELLMADSDIIDEVRDYLEGK